MSDQGVVFAAYVPDRFETTTQAQSGVTGLYKDVRRPVRGIQIKGESFSTLRIFKGSGEAIPLVNAGSRDSQSTSYPSYQGKSASNVYSNFFIQQVDEARVEKQQIVMTFGEAYIFFYGEQPRVLNINGALLNTFDFNWEAEWWHNYENYLRGTKCVENDARVFLTIDETLITGYIIAASASKQALERNWLPFQFQLFVTGYTTFSRLGDPSADQERREPVTNRESRMPYQPMLPRAWWGGAERYIVDYRVGPDGKIDTGSMSFTDKVQLGLSGLQQQVQLIQNYWGKVSTLVGELASTLSESPVRIPYGWAGATALNEYDPAFRIVSYKTEKEPVRFSTFRDNVDEYVGGSSQYESARAEGAMGSFFKSGFSTSSLATAANLIATSVSKARAQWNSYGLYPPNDELTAMLNTMKKLPFVGKIVGKAQRWASGAVTQTAAAVGQVSTGLALASAGVGFTQGTAALVAAVPVVASATAASVTAVANQLPAATASLVPAMAQSGSSTLSALGRSGNPAPGG